MDRPEEGIHGYVFDGMNAEYACIDWEAVQRFLARNADVDRTVSILET
jgi:hypothetical protein